MPESCDSAQKLPDKAVARFWMLMGVKYGHKWTSQFTDDLTLKLAQEEWARELSGFDMQQIKSALEKCVSVHPSWPPTIGEFKKLCEIDLVEFGIPSVETAWTEICIEGKKLSHGVVLAARNDHRCDVYNWRLLPMDRGLKLFAPIYNEYLKRAIAGAEFKLPIMIENKQCRPVTFDECKQHAAEHIEAMKKLL